MTLSLIAKGHKLLNILLVSGWRRALLRHRVAAGPEHASVLRQLGDIRTVVDIGANRGQFALVARHCFSAARIFSFEPLAGPANTYQAVFAEDERTSLHQAAIGPQSGKVTIHVSKRDDSSSLLRIAAAQSALFPGTEEAGQKLIDVGRLAEFLVGSEIEEPALLKLDVQGFELQALMGCEDLLEQFTWVYVECSFIELYEGQAFADAVIAWLRERRFMLEGVYNMAYNKDGRAVQADFLFHETANHAAA